MKEGKELPVVFIVTIIYGFLVKLLIGVPYMPWGEFNYFFWVTFILWWLYSVILYFTVKIAKEQKHIQIALIVRAFLFGLITTFIKIAIDTVVEIIIKITPNMLIVISIMEVVNIVYGMAIIFFLFTYILKNSIKLNLIRKKIPLGILAGCLLVYSCVIGYYVLMLKYGLDKLSNLVQDIGSEQAIQNLTIVFARRTSTVGMVVLVIFYNTFWWMLTKSIVSTTDK